MISKEAFIAQLRTDIDNDTLVLPTLPEVALQVRDAVNDPDISLADIANMVARDPSLSARLLQISNSALYRSDKTNTDLKMAVSRMGLNAVRSVVTSLAMKQIFQATSDVLDEWLRSLWDHSTRVATIAATLAQEHRHLAKDQALLAGLVHDIGYLPILVKAEETPELLDEPEALDAIIAEIHPEIGRLILQSWGFPAEIVAVAAEHENLARDPGGAPDLVDVVQVANLQSYFGTSHPLGATDWGSVPAFSRMGIETEAEEIHMSLPGEADDIQSMIA